MQKITQLFFLIATVAILLTSCANDKDDKGKIFIKMIETTENGVSENSIFKYLDNQIISSENSKQKIEYTYNNGLITKIVSYNKLNESSVVLEYTYENEQLVKLTSSENYVIYYTHASDGKISCEKFLGSSKEEGQKLSHGVLYFKNDNLVKSENVFDVIAEDKVTTTTISYEYDTYNNPYNSIVGYNKLLDKAAIVSKNNVVMIVAETAVVVGDQTISSAKMHTISYKYDKDNNPTEQESESSLNNPNYSKIQYLY